MMPLTQRQITEIKELLNEILLKLHANSTDTARLKNEKKRMQNNLDLRYRKEYEIEDCEGDKKTVATFYDKEINTIFLDLLTFCKEKTQNLRQFIPNDLTDDDYTPLRQVLSELSFTELSLLLPLLTPAEQSFTLTWYKEQKAAPRKHLDIPDLVAVNTIAAKQLQKDNYIQWKSLCQDKILPLLEENQQRLLITLSNHLEFFQAVITQTQLEQLLINAIKDSLSFTLFAEEIAIYLSNHCRKNILNLLIQNNTLLTILKENPLQSFFTEISEMLDTEQKKALIDQWIASGDLIAKIKQESSPWSFFHSNLAQHLIPEQKQQIKGYIKKHILAELTNDFSDICFLKDQFCELDRQEQKQILQAIGNPSNPKVSKYFLVWTIFTLDVTQKASCTNFKASINDTIYALQKIKTETTPLESIKHALSELLNTLYLIDEKQASIASSPVVTSLASQQVSQLLELFEPDHLQKNENNQQIYRQLNPIVVAAETKQWQISGIPGFFRKCSFNYYRPRETWHTNTANTLVQLWEKGKRLEEKHGYCDWKQIKQQMFNLLEKSSQYSPSFFLGRSQDSIAAYDQFKEQIQAIKVNNR
jgi:hypothetical protein